MSGVTARAARAHSQTSGMCSWYIKLTHTAAVYHSSAADSPRDMPADGTVLICLLLLSLSLPLPRPFPLLPSSRDAASCAFACAPSASASGGGGGGSISAMAEDIQVGREIRMTWFNPSTGNCTISSMAHVAGKWFLEPNGASAYYSREPNNWKWKRPASSLNQSLTRAQ